MSLVPAWCWLSHPRQEPAEGLLLGTSRVGGTSSERVPGVTPGSCELPCSCAGSPGFALQAQGLPGRGSVPVRTSGCCFLTDFPGARMLGAAQKGTPAPNCPAAEAPALRWVQDAFSQPFCSSGGWSRPSSAGRAGRTGPGAEANHKFCRTGGGAGSRQEGREGRGEAADPACLAGASAEPNS